MLLSLVTLVYGILNSKYFGKELKYLLFFVFASFTTDLICYVFATYRLNNSFFLNLYSIVEVLLYIKVYSIVLGIDQFKKILIFIFSFAVTLIGVSLFKDSILEAPSTFLMVNSSIVIMVLSILWFYGVFKAEKYGNILHQPFFWISASSLVYFSSSLFIFLFSTYILAIDQMNFWILHNLIHIAYFSLIIIGFWSQKQLQK